MKGDEDYTELTARDHIAIQIAQAHVGNVITGQEAIARYSYELADALIAQSQKVNN